MSRRAHGEGSLHQRASDGLWCAVVQLGHTAAGKRKRRSFYGRTQTEALEKRAAFLRELEEGTSLRKRPTAYTVGTWLDYWLTHVVEEECEPTTLEGYRIAVNKHITPVLGGILLRELETEDVDDWLKDMKRRKVGVRTQQVALARLRTALNVALARRQQTGVRFNAAEIATMPKSATRRVAPPNMADAEAVFRAVAEGSDRLGALIVVTLALGLRRGEAIGLRWEDVDFDKGVLLIRRRVTRLHGRSGLLVRQGTKMNPDLEHAVAMPEVATRALRSHRARQIKERIHLGRRWRGELAPDGKPNGYVFTNQHGGVLEPREVNAYLAEVRARAKLEHKTFHQLRHDCATLLLAQGVPLWVVSQILRHKSPAITARFYAHLTPELHRDAAARMDDVLGPLVARASESAGL